MDFFAAELAKLQRSAEAARRRSANDNDRKRSGSSDRGDNDYDYDYDSSSLSRPRQRRRHGRESTSHSPSFQSLQRAGYRIVSPVSPSASSTGLSPLPSIHTHAHAKTVDNTPNVYQDQDQQEQERQQQQRPQQQQSPPRERGPVPVRHICLLAVTIDELPYEDIWKEWARTRTPIPANDDRNEQDRVVVSLVCHAKFPHKVQSDFLKRHLLQEPPQVGRGTQLAPPEFRSHRPEWGSIEILRAMLDILHDGLQIGVQDNKDTRYHSKRYLIHNDGTTTAASIPPADMFVFISESCLPIQPLSHWLAQLDATVSYVNARHRSMPGTPRNKYELDQFDNIRLVPYDCRWKADQWLALCRPHALAVRNIDDHLPERDRLWRRAFWQVNASDEMYFPTALAILQLLKPDQEQNDHDHYDVSSGSNNHNSGTKITSKSNSLNNEEPDRATAAASTPRRTSTTSTTSPTTSTPSVPAPAATTATAAVAVAVAVAVEKRPVTYTDWSHGMKNPTSFTTKDLVDVTKKARAQNCLVARKFTGVVDVADWQRFCNK